VHPAPEPAGTDVTGTTPYDDDPAFPLHRLGKIEVRPTVRVRDNAGLALAYTPGVGRVSSAIAERPEEVWRLTGRSNAVAVPSDGALLAKYFTSSGANTFRATTRR